MARGNKEFFEALALLEQEKGIPMDYMFDKISKSIAVACKNNYGGNDDVFVDVNVEKKKFDVYLHKTVVETVNDSNKEISLESARKKSVRIGVGDKVKIKLDTRQFGRIAAQTAKNIIRQGIRDGEREQLLAEFRANFHQIIKAQVDRVDLRNGSVTLKIGKSTAVLPRVEQIPGETFKSGQYTNVYVADIKEVEGGIARAVISRTHPHFVKCLFDREVPEIHKGEIEIKAISREPGSRSKMAVLSHDENIDPIGSCIGPKGLRISAVSNEIGKEKIDIIKYSDDPIKFIAAAIAPAEALSVSIEDEENHICKVTVDESQLSLAIGNKGQNVRLAARLTGWKIDIKPAIKQEASEEKDSTPDDVSDHDE